MFPIGRVCQKIAGRDAGALCVVVGTLEHGRVLIDGQTRRRSCNPSHLEPLRQTLPIAKGASHHDVTKALQQIGIAVPEQGTLRKSAPRPRQQRGKKAPVTSA